VLYLFHKTKIILSWQFKCIFLKIKRTKIILKKSGILGFLRFICIYIINETMIEASEFVLTPEGAIYHLNLKPEMLAGKIILVGDPDRVDRVAARFSKVNYTAANREFRTLTGIYKGEPMTVISTGIGTDNIDIVMTELDALVNIDFEKRTLKEKHTHLRMLRLGTCGGVQKEVEIGTYVLSNLSVGAEGLMNFYDYNRLHRHTQLMEAFVEHMATSLALNVSLPFIPYGTGMDINWAASIHKKYPQILQGITFTGDGFYGPQGRVSGRLGVKLEGLETMLSTFQFDRLKFINIEMETAGILGMAEALGHSAASLSVILANRHKRTFHPNVPALVEDLIDLGLEIMLEADE